MQVIQQHREKSIEENGFLKNHLSCKLTWWDQLHTCFQSQVLTSLLSACTAQLS